MPDTRSASWTASEYVAHHKNAGWFMLLILATIAASGLIYLVTDELISAVVIGIVGLAFGIFAARPPQTLDYVIDEAGLHIGQKSYPYHIFRSFSVLDEGVMPSILLMPMQRFNLPITIYYDPKDEETIVTVLGSHLPHEPREVSAIDRFMSKIRF